MKKNKCSEFFTRITAGGGVIIFVIIAFEFMIMISPFAFFFYSIFNPLFKFLDQYTATRWLTDFFLPHMILPPTLFLRIIRISGSILFIIGAFVFIICALQVYLGKIFKWGIAEKGLYRYIRHPQYLGLALWGIGMCILWPRFITLTLLSLMFLVYYLLAKNEEWRMSNLYGENYSLYTKRTGMFLPRFVEIFFSPMNKLSSYRVHRTVVNSLLILIIGIGSGFILRWITLESIPFESKDNISVLSILPEDTEYLHDVLVGIEKNKAEGKLDFLNKDKNYLGYVMQPDYIMQGMIANTDSEFHLYKQHNTLGMITDWVLHPFKHLRTSPSIHMAKMHNVDPLIARRHHCPLGINNDNLKCENCPYRRVILLEINNSDQHLAGYRLLSLNTTRVPVASIDINCQTEEIVKIMQVDRSTAWEDVPTPAF